MLLMMDMSVIYRNVAVLALGARALYIASRAAADALAGGSRSDAAGRLALGHWIPIATVAWLAAASCQAEAELGVVFGSSVAGLSLGAGLVCCLAPPERLLPTRRAWSFV